jgi:hypothetical protein
MIYSHYYLSLDDDEGISYLRLTFQEALMYIDEGKRHIRHISHATHTSLSFVAFPKSGDPYYRVEKFWATVEVNQSDKSC